ncbi:hypothetical protein [Micromonospora sp. NPDC049282]|uniref:hypothetical protein n=1 Tax=Micromonospora sp. NPDC049282 TaxID=3364269 RepID=UPI0037187AE1
MITRLTRFVAGSYPPLPSLLFAVAWAYGVTGLFAAIDPRAARWAPDLGTAVAAATLAVNLLLMRALDDIRDLDYDRRLHPGRPLAAGLVRRTDLCVLYVAGALLLPVLNAGNPVAALVLAGQLGYGALVIAVHHWLCWPSADNLVLNLLVSFPVQLLLHLYLYVGFLQGTGLTPGRPGAVAIAVVVLASVHLEFAKKITRTARPGERTYVAIFGLGGTVALAVAAPIASIVLFLGVTRPSGYWWVAVLLPLSLVMVAGWRFWHARESRWSPNAASWYLLVSFASYLVLGLRA